MHEKTTTNGRTHRFMQIKLLNTQFVDEIDQIFNINNIEKNLTPALIVLT